MAQLRAHNRPVRRSGGSGLGDTLVSASGPRGLPASSRLAGQRKEPPQSERFVVVRGRSLPQDDVHRWITRRLRLLRKPASISADGDPHPAVEREVLKRALTWGIHDGRFDHGSGACRDVERCS